MPPSERRPTDLYLSASAGPHETTFPREGRLMFGLKAVLLKQWSDVVTVTSIFMLER